LCYTGSRRERRTVSRYKVTSPWRVDGYDREPVRLEDGRVLAIESADIVDKVNGRPYSDGARRVTLDGKPYKRGKGGTFPHYGECAWMNAARDFDDEVFRIRRESI
jgi:hypothetical protein